jgi:hypothetical protein
MLLTRITTTFARFAVFFPELSAHYATAPEKIRFVYREATQKRHRVFNAYAGRIWNAIEFLYKDKSTTGKNFTC